jgi:hypothetical protein
VFFRSPVELTVFTITQSEWWVKRSSQLHKFTLRTLVDNPDTKSKDLWRYACKAKKEALNIDG